MVMLIYLDGALTELQARRSAEGRPFTPDDLRAAIMSGAVERVRPEMMTVCAIMAGLLPIMWSHGCPSCTWYLDALGDLAMLRDHDTTFALVSRAPFAKLEAYRKERGWDVPWYSSFGTDFNYDFHVT